MKKIFLTFLFLFSASNSFSQTAKTPANASNPSAIVAIIQQIATGQGKITKAEYDNFWQQLGITTRAEKSIVIKDMRSNFLLMQNYQKEIWKCAEQSWKVRKVAKCPAADARLAQVKVEMKKINQEHVLKDIEKNSNNLLQSAAKRESVRNTNNNVDFSLSLETIKATEERMERMLKRFETVLREEY